jgi:hypothetical protein
MIAAANSDTAAELAFERQITRLHVLGPRIVAEFIQHISTCRLNGWQTRTTLASWLDSIEKSGGAQFLAGQGVNQFPARPFLVVPKDAA